MGRLYNEPWEQCDIAAFAAGIKGDGVISGLAVTERATPMMGVTVASGSCIINSTTYTEGSSFNLGIDNGHATHDRKDLIIYDSSAGDPAVIKGTAATPPVPPSVPAGDILLAVVLIDAGENTSIGNADITEGRVTVTPLANNDVRDMVEAADNSNTFTDTDHSKLNGVELLADVTDTANVNTAGAVMESDFNAQTILAATANDTPAPLTVEANTLVGRGGSGDISDLDVGAQSFTNLLENGDFESWSAGASVAPDGWTLYGAGAIIARDSTYKIIGNYSAKLTRNGTNCALPNQFENIYGINYFKTRIFTFGCWVYATVANRVLIRINDGAMSYTSPYHSGTPGWEWLTITATIGSSAISMKAEGWILQGDTTAYFDAAILVEGSVCPAFSPKPLVDDGQSIEIDSTTNEVKIDGTVMNAVEAGATADQTNTEIRDAVEAADNSHTFTDADHSKLNGVEAGATANQTNTEIRNAVEAATDSNVFTNADHTKLNGCESNSKDDQSGAEIKTAYEAEANAFTDAQFTKLAGCDSGSKDDQTSAEIVALLPSGIILMWHGTLANIPTGFVLCNGANGTPNLLDKFVRGAASGANPGATGGADTVTLDTTEIPSHTHTTILGTGPGSTRLKYDGNNIGSTNVSTSGTGGGLAHNNIPAYYAIAYIMKT